MNELNTVTMVCLTRGVRQTMRLGPGGANLTDGVGGMSTAQLPRDTDVVLWDSHPPYGQTLDLLLDGFAQGASVDVQLQTLYTMARARPGEARPPQVTLEGNARRTDLEWLISGLVVNEEEALGDGRGGLLRIPVQVTLIQDREPELAVRRKAASGVAVERVGMIVRARKGDTLASIAQQYKVKGGAAAVAKANNLRRGAKLKTNQRITLPPTP